MNEILDLLTRWGVWSRRNPTQGIAPGALANDGTGRGDSDSLDDETALLIDSCILALKEQDAECYEILRAKYLYRGTVRKIAENEKLPKYVVCDLIRKGEIFVWGYYEAKKLMQDLKS